MKRRINLISINNERVYFSRSEGKYESYDTEAIIPDSRERINNILFASKYRVLGRLSESLGTIIYIFTRKEV